MGHETVFFSAADANGSGVFPLSIAVMADIHGNDAALERCLTDAEKKGIRNYLFLGDYAGELAHPERVMRLLYGLSDRYSCLFIRGKQGKLLAELPKRRRKGLEGKGLHHRLHAVQLPTPYGRGSAFFLPPGADAADRHPGSSAFCCLPWLPETDQSENASRRPGYAFSHGGKSLLSHSLRAYACAAKNQAPGRDHP